MVRVWHRHTHGAPDSCPDCCLTTDTSLQCIKQHWNACKGLDHTCKSQSAAGTRGPDVHRLTRFCCPTNHRTTPQKAVLLQVQVLELQDVGGVSSAVAASRAISSCASLHTLALSGVCGLTLDCLEFAPCLECLAINLCISEDLNTLCKLKRLRSAPAVQLRAAAVKLSFQGLESLITQAACAAKK